MSEAVALPDYVITAYLVVYVLVPFFAVRTENTDEVTPPLTFLAWFLAGYVGPIVVAFYVGPKLGFQFGLWLPSLAVSVVSVFVAFRHLVRRARDAGFGRNLAFAAIVPLITLGCAAFLVTSPRVPRDGSQ